MIARIWSGKTSLEHSDAYTKLIKDRDLPNYERIEGFVKHRLLRRSDAEFTYFELITFWKDIESVKKFSGPDYSEAVGYQEDQSYLCDFPGSVMHFDVIET